MVLTAMRSGWGRLAMAVLGALIYAVGINFFVTPLGLITGGLMGTEIIQATATQPLALFCCLQSSLLQLHSN